MQKAIIQHYAWVAELLVALDSSLREPEGINPDDVKKIQEGLARFADNLEALEMKESAELLRVIRNAFPAEGADMLVGRLRIAASILHREADRHVFAYIPESSHAFFEQDQLFGPEVDSKFKSLRQEIKNAGNSLAAELPDACVFYSMRIVETLLRELAKECRVTKVVGKHYDSPIEHSEMKKLIEAIRSNYNKKRGTLSVAKQAGMKDFYNGALAVADAYRESYRNPVMHARSNYKMDIAKDILGHAKEFAQRLAVRLGENGARISWRSDQD